MEEPSHREKESTHDQENVEHARPHPKTRQRTRREHMEKKREHSMPETSDDGRTFSRSSSSGSNGSPSSSNLRARTKSGRREENVHETEFRKEHVVDDENVPKNSEKIFESRKQHASPFMSQPPGAKCEREIHIELLQTEIKN